MKLRISLLLSAVFLINTIAEAQSPRINDDKNNIGWISYTGTFKLNRHLGIHTEYQFRRTDWLADWQQSQIRAGVNYYFSKNVSATLGYSEIETFEYGKYPFTKGGKQFSEHRAYQQFQFKSNTKFAEFTHRYRLEQRWIGKQKDNGTFDGWRYVNRFRYMVRADIPITKKLYGAAYDELFVSFGDQVRYNMFDQNRFAALIGYKFSPVFKLEGGFFSQIVQQGGLKNVSYLDPATGNYTTVPSTVMQYNTGFIINSVFLFDLSRKEASLTPKQ